MTLDGIWHPESLAKGLASGLRKGVSKGRHDEALRMVRALLRRQVGPVPAALDREVRALETPVLRRLATATISFESAHDLGRWLAKQRR